MIDPLELHHAGLDKYLDMPPGLDGYWWETDDFICVPVVIAKRKGAFSLFLKELSAKNKTIFFPTIISAKLDALLRAKGFQDAYIKDEMMGIVDGLALVRER